MQTNEVINIGDKSTLKSELFTNIEAEQALIGSILWDNKNFEKISEFLIEDHFVDQNNKIIFKTIKDLLKDLKDQYVIKKLSYRNLFQKIF